MNMSKKKTNSGFTLVELLVVVAIIAVIGAGVAVTYRNLDDKAKTAMEISDISTIKSVIKQWSAINDLKVPNEMDSLIDTEGNLYSQMTVSGSITGVSDPSSSGKGLYGPMGYTLMAKDAPSAVISALASVGVDSTYLHLVASSVANANDSTFETGMMGGNVDTSKTLATFLLADTKTKYEAIRDANWADATGEEDAKSLTVGGETFKNETALTARQTEVKAILDAPNVQKLAFIYPGGGAQMSMGPTSVTMPMNLTEEIISNIGLRTEEIATPGAEETGKKYYLVVMGLGRFTSIYNGKSIRLDCPPASKRKVSDTSIYNRYFAVIRVPVADLAYNSMTGTGEPAQIVDILSPQGYSVAALNDNYINDTINQKD